MTRDDLPIITCHVNRQQVARRRNVILTAAVASGCDAWILRRSCSLRFRPRAFGATAYPETNTWCASMGVDRSNICVTDIRVWDHNVDVCFSTKVLEPLKNIFLRWVYIIQIRRLNNIMFFKSTGLLLHSPMDRVVYIILFACVLAALSCMKVINRLARFLFKRQW